jgi:hypothetical protein
VPVIWLCYCDVQKNLLHIHAVVKGPPHLHENAEELWWGWRARRTVSVYDPGQRGIEYLLNTMEDNDVNLFLPGQNPPAEAQNMDEPRH